VDARLRDRDAVQGAVELAVAAAVEPMAAGAARACFERCDATVTGELRVGLEAVDRADLAEQLRGGERTAAGKLQQGGGGLRGQGRQLALEFADRAPQ
jgi:hypothetical protein